MGGEKTLGQRHAKKDNLITTIVNYFHTQGHYLGGEKTLGQRHAKKDNLITTIVNYFHTQGHYLGGEKTLGYTVQIIIYSRLRYTWFII